jgi:hypothetical protein
MIKIAIAYHSFTATLRASPMPLREDAAALRA